MILTTFTLAHVVISLVGIASGLVVLTGLLQGKALDWWTPLFLWTTVATSVTGFGFPVDRFLPSHAVGILSLLVLAPTLFGLYTRRLAGAWRGIYATGAVVALYLNVFVLVVQLFRRVPPLAAAAPTQSEPPFVAAQAVTLLAFIGLGASAVSRFRRGRPLLVPADGRR